MLFNSFGFLVFFPLVCVAYFFVTHKVRKNIISQILLLAFSLFFYACWKPAYLVLILFSVVVTYASGILMQKDSASDAEYAAGGGGILKPINHYYTKN